MADTIPVPIPTIDDLDIAGYVEYQLANAPDGSTITLPPSPAPYFLVRPIRTGKKCFRIQGGGTWRADGWYPPANWNWTNNPDAASGTVIYAPNGFLVADFPDGRRPEVSDLVVIGDGTGVGIDVVGTNEVTVRNVFVANFDVGVRLRSSLDNHFDGLRVRGCNTGVLTESAVTDTVFDLVRIEACGQAVLLRSGTMIHFNGGLIQGNDAGIRIAPAPGDAVSMCSFSRMWWENTAGAVSLAFDASGGNIEGCSFDGCRDGQANAIPLTVGKFWIARTSFARCQLRGTTLKGDKRMTDTTIGRECVFHVLGSVPGVANQKDGTWQ